MELEMEISARSHAKITWKNEGAGVGQVYFVPANTPEMWPYGSLPEGVEDLGWLNRAEAKRIAKERGVAFEAC